ncbi:uncharacterized protein DDB_G0286299-like [Rhipicephalus sanguineus]|uniref:uncharacterized protein DDB_G0286299-like n=1 Tax=Rhipicephalus sanguineus TaxID=34632 RepID=UPI001893DE7E|nr:uncharacterized protein DDB_G0286299-like [Rhipicephalus sanguineus]
MKPQNPTSGAQREGPHPAMFCPIIARRIPAAPDFGPRHGDIAFEELWALKRAFLDMAAYGVYDLVLLHQPVETLVKEALARSCGEAAPKADDESANAACADEVGVEARASSCGGPAPRDDNRRGGAVSSANDVERNVIAEEYTSMDEDIAENEAEDSQDGERECDGGNLEVGVEENPHGASPSDRASHDTAPKAAVEIAEEFGEEGDEPAEDKVGSGIVLVDFRDSASMRELDGATKDLGGPEAKDGKAEKTRKRRKRKKKRNDDEQRGGVGAKENKAIVDEAIVVDAVAHVRDNTSEPNPESEREDRTEEETKKAEVEKPAADSKEDEETKGDAAPPAKKAKAEPARTRPQRKTKSAGARRVRSLEATAKEGEALLRELVHKDSRVPDSGCRRTRSQTRCTTAAPAARQLARKPPAKPARGAKKGAASKRSKKEESEEEEKEEAASAEEVLTTAVYEDGSAGSIEKKDEKDKVNNDEDVGEARQEVSEDANADHKEEPEVSNT